MLTSVNPQRAEVTVHTIPKRQALLLARQAGIVLPVALFALFAATILTLAFVKANTISLRVGGASVVTAETQAAAELQLSHFFTRNPPDPDDGRWSRNGTPCDTPPGIGGPTAFDCNPIAGASLPPGVVAAIPTPRYIDCGNPPRSDMPNSFRYKFNYYQIATSTENAAFGSRAGVNGGVARLIVVPCP